MEKVWHEPGLVPFDFRSTVEGLMFHRLLTVGRLSSDRRVTVGESREFRVHFSKDIHTKKVRGIALFLLPLYTIITIVIAIVAPQVIIFTIYPAEYGR